MALKEHLVQAPASIERLYLVCVAVRDRRHHVGVVDACLHPVHIAPEFQSARNEDLRSLQADLVQNGRVPAPLVLQVMYGIDDARRTLAQQMLVRSAQVGCAGSSLPVIEMEDIRCESQQRQGVQQPPAEEQETALLLARIHAEIEPPVTPEHL